MDNVVDQFSVVQLEWQVFILDELVLELKGCRNGNVECRIDH